MNEVTARDVEEWLEAPTYPNAWSEDEKRRLNKHLLGYHSMNNQQLVYDCLEASKAEDGSLRGTCTIYGRDGEKPFVLQYTLSEVTIVAPCKVDHDFSEWRYDYMGGDLRSCRRCGLHEHK